MPRYLTGSVWTAEEDATLAQEMTDYVTIRDMAKSHRRSVGSINQRMKLLTKRKAEEEKEEEQKQEKYVMVFDTETTGFAFKKYKPYLSAWKEKCRLIQLAWELRDNDGKLIENNVMLLQPTHHNVQSHPGAIEKHGITHEKAMTEGVPIEDVFMKLADVLTRVHTIVAFNVGFDDAVMQTEMMHARRFDLQRLWKTIPKHCAMLLHSNETLGEAKRRDYIENKFDSVGYRKTIRLANAHLECGFNHDGMVLHQADADTQLCSDIYFYHKKRIDARWESMSRYNRISLTTTYADRDLFDKLNCKESRHGTVVWDMNQGTTIVYQGHPYLSYLKKLFANSF